MRALLPLTLLASAFTWACSTAEPSKPQLSKVMVHAVTCKVAASKLVASAEPGSDLFKAARFAEAVADIGVTISGSDPANLKAAEQVANADIDEMIAGKSTEDSQEALRAKVSDCMPATSDDDTSPGRAADG